MKHVFWKLRIGLTLSNKNRWQWNSKSAYDFSSRKLFSMIKWYLQKILSEREIKCQGKPEAFYSISSPIHTPMSPTYKLFSAFCLSVLPLQSRNFHIVLILSLHPQKGKVPSTITMSLTKNPPLVNFSISDDHFISCLTQLATAPSSPDLT